MKQFLLFAVAFALGASGCKQIFSIEYEGGEADGGIGEKDAGIDGKDADETVDGSTDPWCDQLESDITYQKSGSMVSWCYDFDTPTTSRTLSAPDTEVFRIVSSSAFSPPNALEYFGYDEATLSVVGRPWDYVADCATALLIAKVSVESTPHGFLRFMHLDRFSLAFGELDPSTLYLSEQDSGGSPKKSYRIGQPTGSVGYYYIGYDAKSNSVFGGFDNKDDTGRRATSEPLRDGEWIHWPCSLSTGFRVGVKGATSSVRVRYDDVALLFSQ